MFLELAEHKDMRTLSVYRTEAHNGEKRNRKNKEGERERKGKRENVCV